MNVRYNILRLEIVVLALASLVGCMKWEYNDGESFATSGAGLFVINEGNFQYGNASLSYYNPATKSVENEVFYRANAMKLGDVAQSMTIHNGIGWVVVNNSHVIFAIDLVTFKEVGRIENLTTIHTLHIGREGLRHAIVGQSHIYHQPQAI